MEQQMKPTMPTLDGFKEFVCMKMNDEGMKAHYNYHDTYKCAFGQYLTHLGWERFSLGHTVVILRPDDKPKDFLWLKKLHPYLPVAISGRDFAGDVDGMESTNEFWTWGALHTRLIPLVSVNNG